MVSRLEVIQLLMAWGKTASFTCSNIYGPLHGTKRERQIILMSVEEYEAVRLIDMEGMTQEECAEQMGVARTTVQRIYTDARKKLATSLVEGYLLKIEGGDYKICEGESQHTYCNGCRRNRYRGAHEEGTRV